MKNLFLALVATVLIGSASWGQIVIDLDPGNSTWLEVPQEIKSKERNASISTTFTTYVPKAYGYITMNFDNNNRVISIAVPKNSKINNNSLVDYYATNYTKNSRHGCWDKPSEMGVVGCMIETTIATIISWF